MKTDVRLMKEELNGIERNQNPKERSLTQLKASLESMQTSKEGLESEVNQELLATLSSRDQKEVSYPTTIKSLSLLRKISIYELG